MKYKTLDKVTAFLVFLIGIIAAMLLGLLKNM